MKYSPALPSRFSGILALARSVWRRLRRKRCSNSASAWTQLMVNLLTWGVGSTRPCSISWGASSATEGSPRRTRSWRGCFFWSTTWSKKEPAGSQLVFATSIPRYSTTRVLKIVTRIRYLIFLTSNIKCSLNRHFCTKRTKVSHGFFPAFIHVISEQYQVRHKKRDGSGMLSSRLWWVKAALMNTCPTSPERLFSAAVDLVSKKRSRISDKSIDVLCAWGHIKILNTRYYVGIHSYSIYKKFRVLTNTNHSVNYILQAPENACQWPKWRTQAILSETS